MELMKLEALLVAGLAVVAFAQPACGGGEGTGGTGGSSTTESTSSSSGSTGVGGGASASSSSSGVGGMAMIDCPNPQDTTENVTETDCSILQQDCPPGTGCEPSGTTATHCVAGNGLKGPKAECKDGECKPGLRCVFGKCAPPCCAGNDAPCEGGACVVNFQITGNIAIRYCIYQESCDPFADMPCASAGEQCYPSILPYAFCAPPNPGPGGAGAPCPDGLLDCLGGHVCYSGTCRLACDLANYMSLEPGKGGCEAGDVCVTSTGITTVPGIGFCN